MQAQMNIDGSLIQIKPSKKNKKINKSKVFPAWSCIKLDRELELKLPNEFKGCIKNYNCRSVGGEGQIDENNYRY